MNIRISDRYLAFPIARDAGEVKLGLYVEGEKRAELDLKLSDKPDHIYTMDMERYMGEEIVLRDESSGDGEEGERLSLISCRSDRESSYYEYRPQLHYTADEGWINDPNGLVYSDGVYHLYYQWNPYGSSWGNMHWGHAVSRDLINWEQHSMVMEPDEYGTVFSGSAYKDINNAAAFGRDALLYFYTAAGGTNKWSVDRGAGHTQRLAVSFDGGEHLEKKGLLIDHIKGGNRDPKVFYHDESSSYIMVLYLDENEFAIFRSPDLLHWTESQRLSAEGMWECPDLFCLPIDGDRDNSKWVFWSADGYYMLGSFDGYRFNPETEVLHAYGNGLPYAAQTYSGPADRVISIAWLRTTADNGIYRGMMSIPMELALTATTKGTRLKISPVRELWEHFDKADMTADKEGELCYQLEGRAAIIVAEATSDTPVTISIGKSEIDINKSFGPVTIVLDSGIIEYYYDDGLKYFCLEADEDLLTKSIHVKGEAVSAVLYEKRRE